MAKMELTGFEDVEKFLKKLAKPEAMAIKAVKAAAPILTSSLKKEIANAADQGYATGELIRSVKETKAQMNGLGAYSVVRPTGEEKRISRKGKTHTVRNAEKLAYLEYGTSNGQEGQPVRQSAISAAQAECERIMRETIYSEVDKL